MISRRQANRIRQDVSVPAAGQGDHKAKPGVVCRNHIYSDAARFLVPCGDYGLWHSRAVLSWRVSNTMDADFCVAALDRYGVPELFNTDRVLVYELRVYENA